MKKLGIVRELSSVWERRVPITPEAVRRLRELNIEVKVQPSTTRCFGDQEYREAGAVIDMDLSDCHVIVGIKPIQELHPDKTYLMYSRLASGALHLRPYFENILSKRVSVIDYERIRDENGRSLVGSSKLAGFIGAFNALRVLGEYLLLRKGISSSLLHMGGSAYMHRDKKQCMDTAEKALATLVLPQEMLPVVIGITGSGIVAEGALEFFRSACSDLKVVKLQDLENLESFREESFLVCQISRNDYQAPLKFATHVLPRLDILINAIAWQQDSSPLISIDEIKVLSESQHPRHLSVISDITAMKKGPIEFFKEECPIEAPYFLYDPVTDTRYESYRDAKKSSDQTLVYLGVEQLPAELPIDASEMFSEWLQDYLPAILEKAFREQNGIFEMPSMPAEVERARITLASGKVNPDGYSYLLKLLE